ncbi:hypothetical protein EYF80_016380 [Liparis tanakae]|uniref:Uncharacterized protein n=1 Tax=Liparis tanakae TaxID=230148 RepID=A0A4Z2I5W1_9TELE|nr:hypothetical protein EYF80_016380 [Liparis tanakae]
MSRKMSAAVMYSCLQLWAPDRQTGRQTGRQADRQAAKHLLRIIIKPPPPAVGNRSGTVFNSICHLGSE